MRSLILIKYVMLKIGLVMISDTQLVKLRKKLAGSVKIDKGLTTTIMVY